MSEYVSFSWFQWSYYWDSTMKENAIHRWLGPAKNVGQPISYNVLMYFSKGVSIIVCSSVIPIPPEDYELDNMKNEMRNFLQHVEDKIGNYKEGKFF